MPGAKPGLGQDAEAVLGPEPGLNLRVQETVRPGPLRGPELGLNLRVQETLRPGPLKGPQP